MADIGCVRVLLCCVLWRCQLHERVLSAVERLYVDHRAEAGPEWEHKPLVIH